jgi:hypothetical protein
MTAVVEHALIRGKIGTLSLSLRMWNHNKMIPCELEYCLLASVPVDEALSIVRNMLET